MIKNFQTKNSAIVSAILSTFSQKGRTYVQKHFEWMNQNVNSVNLVSSIFWWVSSLVSVIICGVCSLNYSFLLFCEFEIFLNKKKSVQFLFLCASSDLKIFSSLEFCSFTILYSVWFSFYLSCLGLLCLLNLGFVFADSRRFSAIPSSNIASPPFVLSAAIPVRFILDLFLSSYASINVSYIFSVYYIMTVFRFSYTVHNQLV